MTGVRTVGLHGYAGAGKDAAAQALIADGWTRRAFADLLKTFLEGLDPFIPPHEQHPGRRLAAGAADIGWDRGKRTYPEMRRLMQATGTHLLDQPRMRAAFIAQVLDEPLPAGSAGLVITDVRKREEFDAVRAAGGLLVHIDRPGVGPVNGHDTETELDGADWDAVIVNDGALADLHLALRALVYDEAVVAA